MKSNAVIMKKRKESYDKDGCKTGERFTFFFCDWEPCRWKVKMKINEN